MLSLSLGTNISSLTLLAPLKWTCTPAIPHVSETLTETFGVWDHCENIVVFVSVPIEVCVVVSLFLTTNKQQTILFLVVSMLNRVPTSTPTLLAHTQHLAQFLPSSKYVHANGVTPYTPSTHFGAIFPTKLVSITFSLRPEEALLVCLDILLYFFILLCGLVYIINQQNGRPTLSLVKPKFWLTLHLDHMYGTLITIITQWNTPIMIYVSNLDRVVSSGMCRVCWFAYYFTFINIQYKFDSPGSYSITIVYIPVWHKMMPTNKSQWYLNSPIVCAVLALDNWNYCSGEQAQQPNIHDCQIFFIQRNYVQNNKK